MPKKKPIKRDSKPTESQPIQVQPSEKQVDVKGLVAFALIFLIVAAGAFYFFSSKGEKPDVAPDNRSIIIGGGIYEFRHDIEDFMQVEAFPHDLSIAYSIPPGIDYYRLDWAQDCEQTKTCGVIGIAAVDIVNRVGVVYSLDNAKAPDFLTVAGNNSIIVYTKKEMSLEQNLSKLKGVDIILLNPGSSNDTKISYYESERKNSIIIEGSDQENFLRAVDKFTYLILVRFTSQ